MTITIVQINFKFNDARNGHNGSTKSLVEPTIQANGLLWQVWLKNRYRFISQIISFTLFSKIQL